MILKKNTQHFKEGAYAIVFLDKKNNIAVKVFKNNEDESKSHEHCTKTYNNEIEAYRLASENNDLKPYIPQFHGKQGIQNILNANDEDISNNFYLDLNYKMELISGQDHKFGTLDNKKSAYFGNLFKNAGIHYYKDASVFLDDDGNVKKIIDFSIAEIELFH